MMPICFLASGGLQNICKIHAATLIAYKDVGGPDGAGKRGDLATKEHNFVLWEKWVGREKICNVNDNHTMYLPEVSSYKAQL